MAKKQFLELINEKIAGQGNQVAPIGTAFNSF